MVQAATSDDHLGSVHRLLHQLHVLPQVDRDEHGEVGHEGDNLANSEMFVEARSTNLGQ